MWWKIGTIGFGAASIAAGYFALMFGAMYSEKEQELKNTNKVYSLAMNLAAGINDSLLKTNDKLIDCITKENEAS